MTQTPSALVFIHGGDAHETYTDYLKSLTESTWTIAPYVGEKKRWKTRIFDTLFPAGIPTYSPEFPCKNNAKYHEWKLVFELLLSNIDTNAVYIGHSLGGNFLAKYFLETGKKAKEIHLVAPSYGNPGGFELPDSLLGLEKTGATIHLWYSKDDKVCNLEEDFIPYIEAFSQIVVHEFEDRGHFNQEIFPEIESHILEIFRK